MFEIENTSDAKKKKVSFEFIKPKDSFAISVVHDGIVQIDGELKSGTIRNIQSKVKNRSNNFTAFFIAVAILVAIVSIFLGIVLPNIQFASLGVYLVAVLFLPALITKLEKLYFQ